ncbi:MAG: phospho-N-acetylmuramoyl-pentapeptide-transferase [Candidatus Cloacimonadota bacterium]|nr:MAG: phospho-N-acetylmuramoyl-pentapeptide-transferase [Candidatus Cloacimonadota bacterium]
MIASFISSITLRAISSLVIAFIITFLLGPWVIKKLQEKKIGQQIREEGVKEHLKKSGIPTMGGIMIIVSVFVSTCLLQHLDRNLYMVLGTLLGMGALGFADDFLKITKKGTGGVIARYKLLVQTVIGLTIGITLYLDPNVPNTLFVPLLRTELDLGYFYILLTTLTIVGSSNAVNLTDGLDGLATGIMFIVIACMGVVAYLSGNAIYSHHLGIPHIVGMGELSIFCFAMVGSCLGFLWYNCKPAQVFMGDTGSLALGGALGTVAVLCKAELFLIVVGGIFVIEAISVILQVASYRLRNKKRIFLMAPIHHHFELLGWDESKVVIRFWIVTLILALLGMSVLGLNGRIFL